MIPIKSRESSEINSNRFYLLKASKKDGFVIGYVLAGLAMISLVVAALTSGNKITKNVDHGKPERNNLMAAQIIRASATLRDAWLVYGKAGGYTGQTKASLIAAGMGITAEQFVFPVEASDPAVGSVTMDLGVYDLSGVPGYIATNQAVVATGVRAEVCQMINYTLHKSHALPMTGSRASVVEGCVSNTYFRGGLPGY